MPTYGFNFDTTYTDLPDQFYCQLPPQPAPQAKLICVNEALAAEIGLDLSTLSEQEQADIFSGTRIPDTATPLAQAYAGHQFGHFAILGDGRAHLLGEHITPQNQRIDIQFKGSGRTPYSRRGDGKAALAPMLREYIISEAIHHLGIPTTRSLAVTTTGETVLREQPLQGAILTRTAASHIRVGTFAYAAYKQDQAALKTLLDYTINRHTPQLATAQNPAIEFLKHVMDKQATLITHWMRVGFIHGVMNTDNMLISGETIDYGPCAFMDAFDPATVFSSIDHQGRYAYANQPQIAQWNLARLAETLLPFIDDNQDKAIDKAEAIITQFPAIYMPKYLSMMRQKLGLQGAHPEDEPLISDLLNWMQQNHADYTNTFRDLSHPDLPAHKIYQQKPFQNWHKRWQTRLKQNKEQNPNSNQSHLQIMQSTNPAIIPRNHKVEEALEAATQGNLSPLHTFLTALKTPYTDKQTNKPYQSPPLPNNRIYQTFCGT